ncbi:hypothetical protein GWO09_14900 [candidate division KSB1 bacterium]|nr:hypothetical protein [candidate division KSB1 bacterium]
MIRFISHPISESASNLAATEIVRRFEFEYDWRELDINLGLVKQLGLIHTYFGLNSKWTSRLESEISGSAISGDTEVTGTEGGEYKKRPDDESVLRC